MKTRALIPLADRGIPLFVRPFADPTQPGTEISTRSLAQAHLDAGGTVVFLTAGNETARRVYERIGFQRIGTACVAEGPRGDRMIAMAAFKPNSARYREGLSEILTIDRQSGAGVYAPILPGKSLGTRGDAGPFWSLRAK